MNAPPRQLADYLLPVRNTNPVVEFGNSKFTYVDISAVDREYRAIINPQVIPANDAPSRARQVLADDDVIVSTVRPNLNTVAKVTKVHRGAIASTGFCVLRPNPDLIDASYLFHWISSESTVNRLVSLATGATYPAVSDKTIKSQLLELPPLTEQKRISAILDKVDSLRHKRQEAHQLADQFSRTMFVDMFGSRSNTKVLTDYCDFLAGFAFKSDQYVPSNDGVRLLRGVNVGIGCFEWSDTVGYPLDATAELDRYRLLPSDVVLAMDRPWISSGLKCAVVDQAVAGNLLVQRVARLRPKQPEFGMFIFNCLLGGDFKNHCRITETTIPHISPKDFATFQVPDVTDAEIRTFSGLVEKVRCMSKKAIEAGDLAEQLQAALQGGIFVRN